MHIASHSILTIYGNLRHDLLDSAARAEKGRVFFTCKRVAGHQWAGFNVIEEISPVLPCLCHRGINSKLRPLHVPHITLVLTSPVAMTFAAAKLELVLDSQHWVF